MTQQIVVDVEKLPTEITIYHEMTSFIQLKPRIGDYLLRISLFLSHPLFYSPLDGASIAGHYKLLWYVYVLTIGVDDSYPV